MDRRKDDHKHSTMAKSGRNLIEMIRCMGVKPREDALANPCHSTGTRSHGNHTYDEGSTEYYSSASSSGSSSSSTHCRGPRHHKRGWSRDQTEQDDLSWRAQNIAGTDAAAVAQSSGDDMVMPGPLSSEDDEDDLDAYMASFRDSCHDNVGHGYMVSGPHVPRSCISDDSNALLLAQCMSSLDYRDDEGLKSEAPLSVPPSPLHPPPDSKLDFTHEPCKYKLNNETLLPDEDHSFVIINDDGNSGERSSINGLKIVAGAEANAVPPVVQIDPAVDPVDPRPQCLRTTFSLLDEDPESDWELGTFSLAPASHSRGCQSRKFPPPLNSLGIQSYSHKGMNQTSPGGCTTASYCLRSFRHNGRFVLREVRAPTHEYFRVSRQDGCLKLELMNSLLDDSSNDDDDDDETDGELEETHIIEIDGVTEECQGFSGQVSPPKVNA